MARLDVWTPTLALALLLAGCASPVPPAAVSEGAGASSAWALGEGVLALEGCRASCFEPSVAVDAAGRIFATAHVEDELALSIDGGRTWTRASLPPLPGAVPSPSPPSVMGDLLHAGVRGDGLLMTDPLGRLWYVAMVGANAFQVARSDDAAASWAVDALLRPAQGASPAPIDRPWLGFAPDGTAHITFMQFGTGVWTARSDDGGATWVDFVLVGDFARRPNAGDHGGPLPGADGDVVVPLAWPAPGAPQAPAPPYMRVALSEDGGASYTLVDVVPQGPPPESYRGPMGARQGVQVLMAWPEGRVQDLGLHVVASQDGGQTWGEPVVVSQGVADERPWLRIGALGARIAWLDENGGLHLARGMADGWEVVQVVESTRGSHHATLDLLPDGRAVVAWSTSEGVFVAVEGGSQAPPSADAKQEARRGVQPESMAWPGSIAIG